MSSGCARCEGWGCRTCIPLAMQLEADGGEQGLTAEELEAIRLRQRVAVLEGEIADEKKRNENLGREVQRLRLQEVAVWAVLGKAWRREDITLAQAVEAKCRALEGLS